MAQYPLEVNPKGATPDDTMSLQSLHAKEDGTSVNSAAISEPGNGEILDAKSKEAEADNTEYPGTFALMLITIALCLAVFCASLDNTIIATAIPEITNHFKALDDVGWYGSAYFLTCCAFQLFFGKLYTFFSIKWVFLIVLGIFELGSLICGVAPTSEALIVGRAIAGVGSAGLFTGALLIIAHSVPLAKRSIYTAFIASMC